MAILLLVAKKYSPFPACPQAGEDSDADFRGRNFQAE
jgi:hypothetical protein